MKHYLIIISLLLFLSSCGGDESPQLIELEGKPIQVEITALIKDNGTHQNTFTLNGTITAKEEAMISTRIMGTITQIAVKEGQIVRKGQILARVNNTDLKAQSARIKAQISEAEAAQKNIGRNYQRFKNLYDSKSVTQQEFNEVEMQLEMANSRVNAAKEALNELNVQLNYASVIAPFNGRITKKMANQGNMTNPGVPLFSMESTGGLLVVVHMPASEIKTIKLKDQVTIVIPDLEKEIQGQVTLINPSATHNGHQYKVEISIASTDSKSLLSGMNAKVAFSNKAVEQKTSTIWVPKTALIYKGQLTGVYTVSEQHTALLRWLQLGEERDNQVEVVSGLRSIDQIIVKAEGKLYNGAKITDKK